MTKILWEAKLDNQYDCKVTRVDEYTGLLSVIDNTNGNKLLEQEVTLSFAAIFGADLIDIGYWEELAIGVVDERSDSLDSNKD